MPKATRDDLKQRVLQALAKKEACVYDVAIAHQQLLRNVQHLSWFRNAIAQWFIDNVKKYAHLKVRDDQPSLPLDGSSGATAV